MTVTSANDFFETNQNHSNILSNRISTSCQRATTSTYKPLVTLVDSMFLCTYTYDGHGNVLSYWKKNWVDGRWLDIERCAYTYDSLDQRISETYEQMNVVLGEWWNDLRHTYTYDSIGRILFSTTEQGAAKAWSDIQVCPYTYSTDSSGNTVQTITYANSALWVYTYNQNGKTLSYLRKTWSNNSWVFEQLYTYTYEDKGNNITKQVLFSNQVDSWKSTFTYDADGHMLTELGETWQNSAWWNSYQRIYTYDSNGNLLSLYHNSWNGTTWSNYLRWTYSYSNNGDKLTELYEGWNSANNNWTHLDIYLYAYDGNGNAIRGEHYAWTNNAWYFGTNGITLTYNKGSDYLGFNGSWVDVRYTTTTNIETKQITPKLFTLFQNYPNPFNPTTIISFNIPSKSFVSLKVFDITGRETTTLMNQERLAGTYQIPFNASKLSSGIYFYRLSVGSMTQVKKMLLIK